MATTRRFLTILGTLVVLLGGAVPLAAAPGDSVVPGDVRVDATFHHIGVYWNISGDDDTDSTMTLEYRAVGTADWNQAADAMRSDPAVVVNGSPLGLNAWAASAMFVEPGVTYELRLTLTDPDGGGTARTVTATARTKPVADPTGRQRNVVPGGGGGDGTAANPFRGLQAAADAAQPGDVFHVAAGTYDGFAITTSGTATRPIAFVGPDSGQAIIDGGGTDREVIAIGTYDRPTGYVIVRNLVVQNGRWGIDAQRTHDIVIEDNTIRDVGFGVYNRRGAGDESNQTVCNNTITGRTAWPGSGIPAERGIDLRGTGNAVCYNRVTNFGDCISVQPSTGASFGNDVYGNDAAYCVDDGIEIDYNRANVRVWRNRVTNARMGISVQPIYGGPAYLFRNELFNLESNPIKLNNSPSGLFVAHNTAVKLGNGLSDPSAPWTNAVFRNNLFLGTAYAFEFTTVAPRGFRDFDYGGWGTTREIGGTSAPFFKWDNVRSDRISDLPPGVEDHGTAVDFGDLVDASLPPRWDVAVTPGSRDLRLANGSAGIDRGAVLANLNDGFSTSGAPDLGAFERGQPAPHYGPGGNAEPGPGPDPQPTIHDSVGLADPATGVWRLRSPDSDVSVFYYGNPGDVPLVGDWDCDEIETPGLYRQSDGFVYLRNSNTQGNADLEFYFGDPGDVPLAGDFNGDGCDTVSLYRRSEGRVYVINRLGDGSGGLGAAEYAYYFGNPGDKAFVGDFGGNGTDTIGLHRESTGLVYFRNSNTQGIADFEFYFGDPGDRIIAADWSGDGVDTVGIYRPSVSRFYFRFTNTQGNADAELGWGEPSWFPVAGHLHED